MREGMAVRASSISAGTLRQWALRLSLAASFLLVLGLPFVMRPRQPEAVQQARRLGLPERTLVIISPHWEGIQKEFEDAFSEWTARNRGHVTEVEWIDVGGTSDDVLYVLSEFERSPDGINIDLFFGGGLDPYLKFAQEGLLSRCTLPDSVLAPIPPTFAGIELYDPEQRWFGAALSGFGIIYNRKVLELMKLPEPQTWDDLARPEYFTWVGSGDPRSSGSVHMAYEIILQAYGWEEGWATIVRMGGNTRSFSRSASQVPKDTAMGEIACGAAIDVYAWRQVAEVGGDRIGFHLPQGLTVINPDSIAVLKGAPHRELAELFVQFVLSEDGQKLWILRPGSTGGPRSFALTRLPVIPGFAERFAEHAVVHFDPFDYTGGFVYDSARGSTRWVILNDLLGAAIIDTHHELASAWKKVKDFPSDHALVAGLVKPPMTEPELLDMAEKRWNDAAFRASTITRWATEARQRYRRVAGGT